MWYSKFRHTNAAAIRIIARQLRNIIFHVCYMFTWLGKQHPIRHQHLQYLLKVLRGSIIYSHDKFLRDLLLYVVFCVFVAHYPAVGIVGLAFWPRTFVAHLLP